MWYKPIVIVLIYGFISVSLQNNLFLSERKTQQLHWEEG